MLQSKKWEWKKGPESIFIAALVLVAIIFASCERNEVKSSESRPKSKVTAPAKMAHTPKTEKSEMDSGVVKALSLAGSISTPDSLIRTFLDFVLKGKGHEAYALLPNLKEYESLYPLMPDADPDPDSPHMMATMLVSNNNKQLLRWLELAKGYRKVSRFTMGTEEKYPGYGLLTGVRIYLEDSTGHESEFPIFRSLIKVGEGYKVWLLLET